jgi:diguanylate cyclase (GGDEF)-like protein
MFCAIASRRPSGGLRRGVAACVPLLLACWLACAAAAAPPADGDRIDALLYAGRTQPEKAAAGVAALLQSMPDQSGLQRVRALELLGWLHATMNDPEGTERAALQLDSLAQQPGPARARADAAARLVRARLLYLTGPMSRADRLATEALARLPDDTPPPQRLPYLIGAADIKDRAGRLDDAVRLYLQALQLADSSGIAWRRSDVRSSLAYTLFEAHQKERAHAMNREATELAAKAGDELSLSSAMTTEAILATDDHDDAAELSSLQSAIDHARAAGAKRDEILGLANIADFYLKRGQYATALEMSQRALPLAHELKVRSSESLALANEGLALIGLHRKDEGLKAVHEGIAMEERAGAITSMADLYSELGQYLEKTGELKEALDAYRQHRRLADEVFRQEQQQSILELQENYDNERRNRELELLSRQSRLNDEQLLQRELHQRLWLLGVVFGLLMLGVVALLLQRARRANKLLASTNELLKVQSERDPLTGLANRRHFQQAMRQQPAGQGFSGTVYLLDVDHFKQINDQHGHAAGDVVLVEIARRLRTAVRDEDLIVRWGGEEFLLVVHALSPDQVEQLAQRLLAAVAGAPVDCDGRAVRVSASIGFATFPLEPAGMPLSWERAIELVDTAMYLAKAHGRNRAYGVRLLHADDADSLERVMRTLEESWREGRVALTLLQGPTSGEGAA